MKNNRYVMLVCLLIGLAIGLVPSQIIAWRMFRMEQVRSERVFLLMATGVGQSRDDLAKWLGPPDRILRTANELKQSNPGGFVPSRPMAHEVWLYFRNSFVVYVFLSPDAIIETSYVVARKEWRCQARDDKP